MDQIMNEVCPNTRGLTPEEKLLEAITGEPAKGRKQ
jgi:hypothetical protein